MKKLFTLISVLVASATIANAQVGIIGGITSSSTAINTENFFDNAANVNQYHAGIAVKINLPLGFALQPELLYQVKGVNLKATIEEGSEVKAEDFQLNQGFAELGLGLQWGIDLSAIRPYVFAQPFVGYQLTENIATDIVKQGTDNFWEDAKNKIEYGIGVGVGVELIEHVQLSFQYYKNIGNLFQEGEINSDKIASDSVQDLQNLESYNGFKLSLALFF